MVRPRPAVTLQDEAGSVLPRYSGAGIRQTLPSQWGSRTGRVLSKGKHPQGQPQQPIGARVIFDLMFSLSVLWGGGPAFRTHWGRDPPLPCEVWAPVLGVALATMCWAQPMPWLSWVGVVCLGSPTVELRTSNSSPGSWRRFTASVLWGCLCWFSARTLRLLQVSLEGWGRQLPPRPCWHGRSSTRACRGPAGMAEP